MKNRYDDILREYNSEILELTPGNQVLHFVLAYHFARLYKPHDRVLEIGCGGGDSTLPLMRVTKAQLTALDVSSEMIRLCKKNLYQYKSRMSYVCEDALAYLQQGHTYDTIISSWTIHNFPWPQKKQLFKAIYNALPRNGYFLLMDKIYGDKVAVSQYKEQTHRYKLLPPQVAKAILDHEEIDFSAKYRMDEKQTIKELKQAGFKKVEIIDRVTRDVVLVATK